MCSVLTSLLKMNYRFGKCFGLTGGVSFGVCNDDPPDDATRDMDQVDVCFGVHPR